MSRLNAVLDSKGHIVQVRKGDRSSDTGNTGGEEPPGEHPMEARVANLEKSIPEIREALARIETTLGSFDKHVFPNLATKADLALSVSKDDLAGYVRASGKDVQDLAVSFQKSITDVQKTINEQTWKYIGLAGVLAGLAFTAAKFIQ